MIRVVALLGVCTLLAGCNEDIKAQKAYVASSAAYKDCLAVSGPQACESQRLTMESDRNLFNSLSRSIKPY
ncbi:hypothetical protein WYO_0178 [Methylobacterium sp. GXF4]|uniref:hypothetical protein n=1 Tax=Methylobacterium sp. GXF4 TaxID=1096546 RepID=UPI0002698C5B|nr:hypothetical protein [Methylobacterium sp. GXF4]EIZ87141.1 hypothetical protein WYO_0178 [Methylobacterium sp. GXF4]